MKRALLLIPLSLLLQASRCDHNPDARYARDYEGCFHGNVGSICNDGPQVCRDTPYELGNYFCSQTCRVDSDCERLPGRRVSCADTPAGALCVIPCDDDADCPWAGICIHDGPGYCHPA